MHPTPRYCLPFAMILFAFPNIDVEAAVVETLLAACADCSAAIRLADANKDTHIFMNFIHPIWLIVAACIKGMGLVGIKNDVRQRRFST